MDEVYTRANAAGAEIVENIEDKPYGGRGFACLDPEAFDLVDDGFFRDVGDDREVLGAPFPSSPIRRRACWDRRRWTSAFITRRQSPSPPARFRAYNSLRPHCFHRNNLGLPMFCKEIVERLGEQILNGGVAVSSEDTQLLLHRRR